MISIEVIQVLVVEMMSLREAMSVAFAGSMAAMAFAVVAAVRSARLTYGRIRAGWVIGAVHGLLMLGVGGGSQLFGRSPENGQVFGAISMLAIALQVAQLALLLPPAASIWAKLARLADILAVTAALGGVVWHFVIVPVADRLSRPLLVSLVVYETLVLAGAAWALVSAAGTDPRRYGRVPHLLGVALAIEAALGLLNLRFFLGAPAWAGVLGACLPMVSSLLVGAAGMQTGRVRRRHRGTPVRQTYRGLVVPYLPVVFSFGTVVAVLAVAGASNELLVWVLVATTAMAIARQFLSLVIIAGLAGRLERQAHEDSLTGVPNRAAFHARGAEVLADAAPGELTAVLLVDLDGFKQVNDLLGHATGDRLLVAAGHVLTTLVGERGMAARLGGDEFALLVPRLIAPAEAEVIAGAVVARLGAMGRAVGIDLPVGGSVGVALALGPGHETAALLGRADAALYAAKAAGKNTYRRDGDLAAAT